MQNEPKEIERTNFAGDIPVGHLGRIPGPAVYRDGDSTLSPDERFTGAIDRQLCSTPYRYKRPLPFGARRSRPVS